MTRHAREAVVRLTKTTEAPRTIARRREIDDRLTEEGRVIGNLLWMVAIVLVALWVLAQRANVLMGGLIHVLLVLAVVTVLIRIITGRKIA